MPQNEHPLLQPVGIGRLELRNRVAVAPMSRVSTAGDGVATREMATYYAAFASGGFGLIITEGTYIDHAYSQAYLNQPAIVTDEQCTAWSRVVEGVHAAGGRIFLQLMHAGALLQGNRHRPEPIAPSPVQPKGEMLQRGYGGSGPYLLPREMTGRDIAQAIGGFAQAASRTRQAGFDGVEVHGANGYLIDQFLTTYTNHRRDKYGGPPENRARLLIEVVEAVRAAVGDDFPIGVRISQVKVNDLDYRWTLPEARAILSALALAHPAYVHVSAEDTKWSETSLLAAGISLTGLARATAKVPVIANGGIDPEIGEFLLGEGHADLVSLGHAALANPDWPIRLAEGRELRAYDPAMLLPEVTLANAARWRGEVIMTNSRRA